MDSPAVLQERFERLRVDDVVVATLPRAQLMDARDQLLALKHDVDDSAAITLQTIQSQTTQTHHQQHSAHRRLLDLSDRILLDVEFYSHMLDNFNGMHSASSAYSTA